MNTQFHIYSVYPLDYIGSTKIVLNETKHVHSNINYNRLCKKKGCLAMGSN